MGKQTMGTPSTALLHRTDNKLYRIQSPQTPIVRPELHNDYAMDNFPNGTNAVVAVISYTGYDMEDAMILNKSSHERGFGYGTIYKSQIIDLDDLAKMAGGKGRIGNLHFGLLGDVGSDDSRRFSIDGDGFPQVGSKIRPKDVIASYFDDVNHRTQFVKYKGDEVGYIERLRILGIASITLNHEGR